MKGLRFYGFLNQRDRESLGFRVSGRGFEVLDWGSVVRVQALGLGF